MVAVHDDDRLLDAAAAAAGNNVCNATAFDTRDGGLDIGGAALRRACAAERS
jgi:hypothetical protein